ncbi:hypothetical protein MAP00_001874 [Monascus purpureus]|nr:hypothetical protein MAP00_001874 [Monascus purpureus]
MGIITFAAYLRASLVVWLLLLSRSVLSFCVSEFEVRHLPGSPSLPRSWAGRLPVPDMPEGNALFFWLFETEDPMYDDNLIIWFAGGPSCSSLVGLTSGNGPISFVGDSSKLARNPYSWTKLGHVLYVDQPVGTGFSTASDPYPVADNDQVTSSFYRWLKSFFARFPHLQSKRVHLIGESYAGIYVPYFATEIVKNHDSFPINLQSLSMGDGAWANAATLSSVGIGSYLQSQSEILGIPDDILAAFAEADHICGFDTILREASLYPPKGKLHIQGNPQGLNMKRRDELRNNGHKLKRLLPQHRRRLMPLQRRSLPNTLNPLCNKYPKTPTQVLNSILNNTCYGSCATFSTVLDYLGTAEANPCFDMYDITATCNTPDPSLLASTYFSRIDVQSALNIIAPSSSDTETSLPFTACNMSVFTSPSRNNPLRPHIRSSQPW